MENIRNQSFIPLNTMKKSSIIFEPFHYVVVNTVVI